MKSSKGAYTLNQPHSYILQYLGKQGGLKSPTSGSILFHVKWEIKILLQKLQTQIYWLHAVRMFT